MNLANIDFYRSKGLSDAFKHQYSITLQKLNFVLTRTYRKITDKIPSCTALSFALQYLTRVEP